MGFGEVEEDFVEGAVGLGGEETEAGGREVNMPQVGGTARTEGFFGIGSGESGGTDGTAGGLAESGEHGFGIPGGGGGKEHVKDRSPYPELGSLLVHSVDRVHACDPSSEIAIAADGSGK